MHALRERERVLDLIEGVTGGRFHPNFNRIGGVKPAAGAGAATKKVLQDIPKGFLEETRLSMERMAVISAADTRRSYQSAFTGFRARRRASAGGESLSSSSHTSHPANARFSSPGRRRWSGDRGPQPASSWRRVKVS